MITDKIEMLELMLNNEIMYYMDICDSTGTESLQEESLEKISKLAQIVKDTLAVKDYYGRKPG